MIRFGIGIVFLLAVLFTVLMLVNYGEALILSDVYPVLPADITSYDNSRWVTEFQLWGFATAIAAAGVVFIWLWMGQFMMRVEAYESAGGRGWWLILLILLLLFTFIAGFVLVPASQDFGKPLALIFLLINSFFIYWFSTAILSPSNVKYAPWLSKHLAVPANSLINTLQGGAK